MKYLLITIFIFGISGISLADDKIDEIYQLFSKGEISRAKNEFSELRQTTVRDGNRLFMASLLEPDGKSAQDKIEAALRSDLDGKYQEEAYFRLIQLAAVENDTSKVISSGKSFLDIWETSRFREQVLAILSAYETRDSKSRGRYFKLLSDEYPASYFGQYSRLYQAENAYKKGNYKTATTMCRRINNSPNDDLTAASLILLSKIGLKNNNAERALFNYNILREQYRHAIGEEELLEALKNISDEKSGQESTEVFEGITYSVQVGVFADKGNARNMEKRAESYGYDSRIKKRRISGREYYVVLAGKFATMQEAVTARQKLEMGENEPFKVITNDEK
ncbi:MAG: SPOR domain-containing protein [candidate division Zixibacteria bacterium]